ncbi:MAG TPA: hypothetical protein VN578_02245 [Candidatus Binatia bacterium]|nr:hypothetical protein [Candidatus Binatia bacterium]
MVLLDQAISESAPFRFFADQQNHPQRAFLGDIGRWPAAIFTFAKLHNPPSAQIGGQPRWQAAAAVRKSFPDTHVFFGMGYSELLLISGGANVERLLGMVTQMRHLRHPHDHRAPLFSKTTTFPLISCKNVHSTQNYESLEGDIQPVITASCEPAFEHLIAPKSDDKKLYARNVYGKSDFLLAWREPVKVAELARYLSDLRKKWGQKGILSKTTTYIETDLTNASTMEGLISSRATQPAPLITPQEQNQLFRLLNSVKSHALRAALSDVTLRLLACLNDPQLGPIYGDMLNTLAYMLSLTRHLTDDAELISEAAFIAEELADLARAAINQRYAGLEFHPETLAHAHLPLLCDIRTIVAAASCTPSHIFNKIMPGKRSSETWTGFVLFGGEASPQVLHQIILALPPASLFTPVQDWWKITHETAHAVFKILDVYKRLPPGYAQYVRDALPDDVIDDHHLINELFANWFDWKYIFQENTQFYLEMIWRSWIRLPVVRESKSQYLARSFAVFICPRLNEFTSLLEHRWQTHGAPWLTNRWQEFTQAILKVPGMRDYLKVPAETVQNALDIVHHVTHIMQFFQSSLEGACRIKGLAKRLHPPYPRLRKDIQLLREGRIILSEIPDPCRLHLEVIKSLALAGTRPKLATETAFLFSLEHSYLMAAK